MKDKLDDVGIMLLGDVLDPLGRLEDYVNDNDEEYSEEFKKRFNEVIKQLTEFHP